MISVVLPDDKDLCDDKDLWKRIKSIDNVSNILKRGSAAEVLSKWFGYRSIEEWHGSEGGGGREGGELKPLFDVH